MKEPVNVNEVIAYRAHDPQGLSRMMTWSFAVHVIVVAAALLVPRNWLSASKPPTQTMVISLGGSVGPKTSGMTPAGARPVEQVAPEPKRPEPVPPAAAKPDVMSIPFKPTKPQTPKPEETPRPPSPVQLPPTTGRQVTPGTSRAETFAKGQDTGISLGGGGTGGAESLTDFCCKGYLSDMTNIIQGRWEPQQKERGTVIVKFTIQRDGQVTDVTVEQHSTFLLDSASSRALLGLRLPRLPDEYKGTSLTIHLTFEYK